MPRITELSSHGFNILGTGLHKNNRRICGLTWVEIICTTVSGKILGRVVTLSNVLFLYQTFCIKENHFMVLLFFMPEIMRQCRDFFEYVSKNIKHVKQLAFFENQLTWLDFQFV